MTKLKLRVFIDVFGQVTPVDKFRDSCSETQDYHNFLLGILFKDEHCYGDTYEGFEPGLYEAEFEICNCEPYHDDIDFIQIKEIGKCLSLM